MSLAQIRRQPRLEHSRINWLEELLKSSKIQIESRSVILSCEYHRSGKYLISANSRGQIYIRGRNYRKVAELRGHLSPVNEVHYGKDGVSVFSGSNDRTIRIWDAVKGRQKSCLTGHQSHVNTVQCSPTELSTLCSGSSDKTVRIWDARQRDCRAMLRDDQPVIATCFSSCGNYIFAGGFSSGDITAWDVRQNDSVYILPGHRAAVTGLSLSPCGRSLASSSADGTIRKWDVGSAIPEESQRFSLAQIEPVQFGRCTWSPSGQMIAAVTFGRKVIVFDAAIGTTLHNLDGHMGRAVDVAFHPWKQVLCSAGMDNYLLLHSV